MSGLPDAWEDDWSTQDAPTPPSQTVAPKKPSSKVTKAQRRAQQQEFNRQLWAKAEGPQEPNYFLESRNVVPLRSEFKPPPILLSRKGPVSASTGTPPIDGVANLKVRDGGQSSEDEDAADSKKLTAAELAARQAREREEKQRRYEERRQELFGTPQTSVIVGQSRPKSNNNHSGNSSPRSLTPPNSRSATPNRSRGRGGGRRGGGGGGGPSALQSRDSDRKAAAPAVQRGRELYDPSYSPRPDSAFVQRRDAGDSSKSTTRDEVKPIRAPRGPDGSGQGGFGFAARGGRAQSAGRDSIPPATEPT